MTANSGSLCNLGIPPQVAKLIGWEYSTAAAAGSAITDATDLTSKLSVVSAADNTKGVQVPVASQGEIILVKNSANAVLKVYPSSATDTFNAGSAGAAVSVAAYAAAVIIRISGTDSIAVEIPAA